jgi:hypothetical protein
MYRARVQATALQVGPRILAKSPTSARCPASASARSAWTAGRGRAGPEAGESGTGLVVTDAGAHVEAEIAPGVDRARIGVVPLWQVAALGMMPTIEELVASTPIPIAEDGTEAFWEACQGGQRRTAEYLLGLRSAAMSSGQRSE